MKEARSSLTHLVYRHRLFCGYIALYLYSQSRHATPPLLASIALYLYLYSRHASPPLLASIAVNILYCSSSRTSITINKPA